MQPVPSPRLLESLWPPGPLSHPLPLWAATTSGYTPRTGLLEAPGEPRRPLPGRSRKGARYLTVASMGLLVGRGDHHDHDQE